MRVVIRSITLFLTLFIVGADYARSDVPLIITYQGVLTGAEGQPVTGILEVSLSLYGYVNGAPDMTLLWNEINVIQFTNGYFAATLGDEQPLPDSIFGRQLYLGISIGGDELAPRRELVSGAYAIQSKFVDQISPENINQFFILAQSMPDADADGYNKRSMGGDDCNDMDPSINPGAIELCDGIDNNCNGQIDEGASSSCELPPHVELVGCQGGQCVISRCEWGWVDSDGIFSDGCEGNCAWVYVDGDCDGWVPEPGVGLDSVCLNDYTGCYTTWPNPNFGDCNPLDPQTHPGAPELCDNLDNDCDLQVDEDVLPGQCPLTEGVCGGAIWQCIDGSIICDYGPYYEEVEVTCDGRDNDCDGLVDEGCVP